MSKKAVTQFCSQVGKELQCSSATKRTLLKGLEEELSELPDEDKISLSNLKAKIGNPSQIAEELQNSIPTDEEKHVQRINHKRKILFIGGILGLSLILLLLAILVFCNGPFYVVETIQEG